MKRRNIAIMAMLALTAGQAFAQRCLPQMKGKLFRNEITEMKNKTEEIAGILREF